jgi:hypothetical protein
MLPLGRLKRTGSLKRLTDMQRVEVRGKPDKNWALPAALALLAVLAAGWWFRGDLVRLAGKVSPGISSRFTARTKTTRPELPTPQIIARRANLREFMQKDLKLTAKQISRYEQYRLYYSAQIQRADRVENRNRSAEVAKLAKSRDHLLIALLGQRNLDSIYWWAEGSRSGISLPDYIKQRETQRRGSSQPRVASR